MMAETTKVLIVDDLEDNRLVLRSALKKVESIQILEASDGKEALEVAERERPPIVLMDIMMPEMDGFEATRRLKEAYPETIVLVITALKDQQTEEKMLSVGANAYIKKPIDRKLLRYKVLNFIKLLESRNEQSPPNPSRRGMNPFNSEVRCFKIHFSIGNEEDMMDFGTWLLDTYGSQSKGSTFRFDTILDAIYTFLHWHLSKHQATLVILEEDFEYLYLSIDLRGLESLDQELIADIAEDCLMQDGFIFFRIPLYSKPDSVAKEQKKLETHEHDLLRKSAQDEALSAVTYVQELGGDLPDEFHDLKDHFDRWRELIEEYHSDSQLEHLDMLTIEIEKIASVMNQLYDFMSLGYAITALGALIKRTDLSAMEDGKRKVLVKMLGLIHEDLKNWWESVFIRQDAQNIHYLDSSLFSSCLQVEMALEEKKVAEDDDDFELF